MEGKSQVERLHDLMSDGEPHRTDEIMAKVYGSDHLGIARIGARIHDLKEKYDVSVSSWKDKRIRSLWWYQLSGNQEALL